MIKLEKIIKVNIFNEDTKININVYNNDTINDIKIKISNIVNKNYEKIRLYPIYNDIIKTGYSFYGIMGNLSFIDNYREYDEFIIYFF